MLCIIRTMVEESTQNTASNNTPDNERRRFILQVVQPGLAGLMDGTISSLAPLFAAALATQNSRTAFLVGLATALGAGISMAFSEALSDDGKISGRGNPVVKRTYRGFNDFLGGYRSRFTILNPGFPDCFYSSVCSSGNRISCYCIY